MSPIRPVRLTAAAALLVSTALLAGPASASPADAGPADTARISAAPESAAPANTGPAHTGPANTGPASADPASDRPRGAHPRDRDPDARGDSGPARTTAADPCGFLSQAAVVPCFSEPAADDQTSSRIFRSLAALTDAAAEGDTIRLLHYDWQASGSYSDQLAESVVAAHERGVDVRLILDEATDPERFDQFERAGVPTTTCDDWQSADEAPGERPADCLMIDAKDYYGPNSNLPMTHTKLWLFEIGGVSHVVAGSSNLGEWDYANAWNDMVRFRDDEALYGFLSDWWDRVAADDWQGWAADSDREATGAGLSAAYLYPRNSADPMAEELSRLSSCPSDGGVSVAMSKWNTDTRDDVLAELRRLADAGCSVRIMADWGWDPAWVAELRDDFGAEEVRWVCRLHHKLTVVDGTYDGERRALAYTGSNIWADGSLLYSNELGVRVGDPDAVAAYAGHYEQLWENWTSTAVDPPTECPH